jgi:hypothetical protein
MRTSPVILIKVSTKFRKNFRKFVGIQNSNRSRTPVIAIIKPRLSGSQSWVLGCGSWDMGCENGRLKTEVGDRRPDLRLLLVWDAVGRFTASV